MANKEVRISLDDIKKDHDKNHSEKRVAVPAGQQVDFIIDSDAHDKGYSFKGTLSLEVQNVKSMTDGISDATARLYINAAQPIVSSNNDKLTISVLATASECSVDFTLRMLTPDNTHLDFDPIIDIKPPK